MRNGNTKTDFFNEILNGYELTAEHKDFILHELELLADGTPRTATDVMNAVEGIESPQKASALMKKMVEAGTAEKFVDKRITYFKAKSE